MAPETGRWLTPDPPVAGPDANSIAAPWSLHPYQYVKQNPITYWDPDGRQDDIIELSHAATDVLKAGAALSRALPYLAPEIAASTVIAVTLLAGIEGAKHPPDGMSTIFYEEGWYVGQEYVMAATHRAVARTAAKTRTQQVADAHGPVVFRGLAEDEFPIPGVVGFFARAPGAGNSPTSHVMGQEASQWISTTKNWANIAAGKYGEYGVAAIDLSKVHIRKSLIYPLG